MPSSPLLLLLLLARLTRAEQPWEPCLGPDNQPITTCGECLWRPECVWCTEKVYSNEPAVGCVVKGSYNCSQEVHYSRCVGD